MKRLLALFAVTLALALGGSAWADDTAAPAAEPVLRRPSLVGRTRAGLTEALAEIGVPEKERRMRVGQLWGWLYVQWLWIDEGQRGKGLAGALLAAAEAEARARGCHGAYIDTFSPVALKVYQRAGYAPFGALADFPKGRTRTFLQKPL